jgi:acyl-CoA thioester hydrolase
LLSEDLDSQAVRRSAEWHSPAHFDEVLVVAMDTARIGTTSFTIHSEVRHFGLERIIARVESVYVLVSAARRETMVIVGDRRRKLQDGAPGAMVDFAGLGMGIANDAMPRRVSPQA